MIWRFIHECSWTIIVTIIEVTSTYDGVVRDGRHVDTWDEMGMLEMRWRLSKNDYWDYTIRILQDKTYVKIIRAGYDIHKDNTSAPKFEQSNEYSVNASCTMDYDKECEYKWQYTNLMCRTTKRKI